jgi:hypothetical protein
MSAGDREPAETRVKDGVAWCIGTDADVTWITTHSPTGLAITSAIPPVFDCYATVVLPSDDYGPRGELVPEHDQAVLTLLKRHTSSQPWWLGYLETGGSDIVFYDAPKVTLYANWHYVLVQAGPEQAATWRPTGDWTNWKNTELPELIFPQDRSWLLSTLWDDYWTCIGGPEALVTDLLADPLLGPRTRQVTVEQDATPPGHMAL